MDEKRQVKLLILRTVLLATTRRDRSLKGAVLDFKRTALAVPRKTMQNHVIESRFGASDPSWSNRILVAAVAGILFLTLFPFRFDFHASLPGNTSPFLLGSGEKDAGALNALLNVLLFAPFGFGLSEKLREKGMSRVAALACALAASAAFSYGIEFIQIYVPTRDSGWEDVFTNAAGSAIGFFLFELIGESALNIASKAEAAVNTFLTLRRSLWIVPVYFGLCLAVSIPLQMATQLSNWDPGAQLLLGNDTSGRPDRIWRGEILRVQLWDRFIPDEIAQKITAGKSFDNVEIAPLAEYDFSGASSFQDHRGFLPQLVWVPTTPATPNSLSLRLDGKSWLATPAPVTDLVKDLEGTNKFSLRVLCAPAEVEGSEGRIVSISQGQGFVNLALSQENANLVFWFRNPLSTGRAQLAWYIPGTFAARQTRDILFSYDGSNLSLYIDGRKNRRIYRLTPGTRLAQLVRRVKPSELDGYSYIFYSLLFIPGGSLLGIVGRRISRKKLGGMLLLVGGIFLPAILLEFLLIRISGRVPSLSNVILSVILTVSGCLWINADHSHGIHDF